MSLIAKSLWFIETNLTREDLTLQDLAAMVEVAPFHLARAFVQTMGQPVMRYIWRRRLTRAAAALVYGRATVLNVALDAGYASHEAFGRAFRAEFGLTPSALRRLGALDELSLTLLQYPRTKMTNLLTEPRIEPMPTRRFAGKVQRYDMQSRLQIPAQWATYNADVNGVPGAIPGDYYGVVFNFSGDMNEFDYLCGQEVAEGAMLPEGFGSVTISGPYARFATKAHISSMNAVWGEVYGNWLNRPGFRARPGPSVEYYPPAFDGMTGEGGFEVWVPIV